MQSAHHLEIPTRAGNIHNLCSGSASCIKVRLPAIIIRYYDGDAALADLMYLSHQPSEPPNRKLDPSLYHFVPIPSVGYYHEDIL